jgi:glutamate-ammonia-ligase adenylyltransferase
VISPEVLGRALAAAPDPERARVALARVGEALEARRLLTEPGTVEHAALLLGFSTAAADFLVAHPEEAVLFLDPGPRDRAALLAEAGAATAELGIEAGLRRFRPRAMSRIAVRDLAGAALEDIVAEITWVAEACLQAAVEAAGGRLAVIGLGKLGGEELNYASDVDVVFLWMPASGPKGGPAPCRARPRRCSSTTVVTRLRGSARPG